MSIEQLHAGGVAGVTLKGQGAAFLVQIASRSGTAALLAKARSTEPRRFGNPGAALNMLRDLGITIGRFDGSEWNPHQKQEIPGNRGRAEVMRKSHEAAAHNEWRAGEIQAAIDVPRSSIPHEEVMAGMDDDIAALMFQNKPVRRKRA